MKIRWCPLCRNSVRAIQVSAPILKTFPVVLLSTKCLWSKIASAQWETFTLERSCSTLQVWWLLAGSPVLSFSDAQPPGHPHMHNYKCFESTNIYSRGELSTGWIPLSLCVIRTCIIINVLSQQIYIVEVSWVPVESLSLCVPTG